MLTPKEKSEAEFRGALLSALQHTTSELERLNCILSQTAKRNPTSDGNGDIGTPKNELYPQVVIRSITQTWDAESEGNKTYKDATKTFEEKYLRLQRLLFAVTSLAFLAAAIYALTVSGVEKTRVDRPVSAPGERTRFHLGLAPSAYSGAHRGSPRSSAQC